MFERTIRPCELSLRESEGNSGSPAFGRGDQPKGLRSAARITLPLVLLAAFSLLACRVFVAGVSTSSCSNNYGDSDMLTPHYYDGTDPALKGTIDTFLAAANAIGLQSPFAPGVSYSTPCEGSFGAAKGPSGAGEHHPAVDLHPANDATNVDVYAAAGGILRTYGSASSPAAKYREYIAITTDVTDGSGTTIGKMVILYAHVDLELDAPDRVAGGPLPLDGTTVAKGQLISEHLYSGTTGGPHLHFEIRYYRPTDTGTEDFYGSLGPYTDGTRTLKSTGPWSLGYWDASHGYGFGRANHHGLSL